MMEGVMYNGSKRNRGVVKRKMEKKTMLKREVSI